MEKEENQMTCLALGRGLEKAKARAAKKELGKGRRDRLVIGMIKEDTKEESDGTRGKTREDGTKALEAKLSRRKVKESRQHCA
jgi:hypothetical protein